MRIQEILRYPVKGLGGDPLNEVEVTSGESIPLDRMFAIAHGETLFDPAHPLYLKSYRRAITDSLTPTCTTCR